MYFNKGDKIKYKKGFSTFSDKDKYILWVIAQQKILTLEGCFQLLYIQKMELFM